MYKIEVKKEFAKEINYVDILKTILSKYFSVENGYKLITKENEIELIYKKDFMEIIIDKLSNKNNTNNKIIFIEDIISKIQLDLLDWNTLKFYEYFNEDNEKIYAIDFVDNNLEVITKIYGINKFNVYIKAYLDRLEDLDKKTRVLYQ